jgi:DNA-binding transcriptional LysR family regulator
MRRIGISRRVVVACPEMIRRHGAPVSPRDLTALPLIDAGEGAGQSVWRLTGPDAQLWSVEFDARLAAGDLDTLVAAAVEGVGAALLPELECRTQIASGQLVRLLPEWGAADGIVHLVFTSRRSMLPGVRAVIDFAAKALAEAAE